MVVDDDENVRLLVKVILTRQGYEVEIASSGAAGLAAMKRSVPDLILLDMAMPDMGGLAFLEAKAKSDVAADIPVIVVSGRSRNADVAAAISLGASNFVAKPFHQDRLLANIAGLLPPTVDAVPSRAAG
ncbi:response regulator [Asticcacaulis biprosthecium]|uniref:response regulator n=1 Tax=Asticcacaulis biprosthecium TaxID=76891 RepID=UPI0002D2F040|nr:response regulator [Asticcacaulis biprosthecium]